MRRRARYSCRHGDEQGMALLAAMTLTLVVITLSILATQIATHDLSSSAVAVKLVQSSDAAEAGIDATIADLQSATALLACGRQSTQSLGSPAASSYTVTVTYYDSSGHSLCAGSGAAPSGTPATALLESVGTTAATTTYGNATWEASVKLTPSPSTASGFDQAMYSVGTLKFSNTATIYGDGSGNDANIYTASDFSCANQEYNYGNLYAEADIDMSNQCGSAGNWWAKGSICDSGKGTVVGSVMAGGDVSGMCHSQYPGTISMGATVVAKGAVARSAISPWPCPNAEIEASCSEDTNSSTNPGPPPVDPFPQWSLNTGTWQSSGYTVINDTTGTSNTGTACSSSAQVYKDLTNMASAGSPQTVIYTDCQIQWNESNCPKVSGVCTWTFANNLAIVDLGGYNTTNSVAFDSYNSTEHDFYMMVPYDLYSGSTTNPCNGTGNGSGNIDFSNKVTTGGTNNSNPLAVLVYTPCSTTLSDTSRFDGQVYSGGNTTITNSFSMDFQLVPVPGFDAGGTGSSGTGAYSVALLYKRET